MESQFWEKKNQNQTGIDPLKILGTGSESSSNELITNRHGWGPCQMLGPLPSDFTYGMQWTGVVCVSCTWISCKIPHVQKNQLKLHTTRPARANTPPTPNSYSITHVKSKRLPMGSFFFLLFPSKHQTLSFFSQFCFSFLFFSFQGLNFQVWKGQHTTPDCIS
jgi:hypothetical protein